MILERLESQETEDVREQVPNSEPMVSNEIGYQDRQNIEPIE